VSRSVMPIVDDMSRLYFGPYLSKEKMGGNRDQIGEIDNSVGTFGKTYVGEPDKLIEELRADSAVMSADTLLVTVPSQLGADFNHGSFVALAAIRDALTI